jgi:hypothetical protein
MAAWVLQRAICLRLGLCHASDGLIEMDLCTHMCMCEYINLWLAFQGRNRDLALT